MIPDDVVEQVREAADIVQIIGEYVNLKRTGSDYRGPCPFHQGKHRNFSVSPKKRMYYCFVCGEHGDVFRFLQKRLGVEWPAAVKLVGEKSGIEVREVDRRREGPDPREPLWELNAAAAEYFSRMLWDDPAGAAGREYLERRGISRQVAAQAELGWAPADPALMREYLGSLGFDDARLLEVGLVLQREETAELRTRFRNRLMFPIRDAGGRHVGFGGRVLGTGEPKYLNSPDSPAFTKGRLLYGLHWARNEIRRQDRALVVEGYFDVIGLIAAGVTTAVAPLGTALTPEQAALLRRYTKNVYLLYDSDRAGLVASFRSGDELLRTGASVRVVTLPDGEDPDSFARTQGAAGLETHIDQAVDVLERKIQLLQRAGAFSALHRKRRAIDRLLPTIRAATDPLMRELYVARTSEVSGVDRAVLLREVESAPQIRSRGTSAGNGAAATTSQDDVALPPRTGRGDRRTPYSRRASAAERELLRALMSRPARIERVVEKLGPESFGDERYRAIYERLLEIGGEVDAEALGAGLGPEAVAVLEELMEEQEAVVDADQTIDDSLAFMRARTLDAKMRRIDRMLPVASEEEQTELIRSKAELRRELALLGRGRYKAFRRGNAR
ncbi:MAG TPA: DNA primase [Gemmatimonadaceae bacterium]|nr:DNA primase [Gemmatimonadaceae bacterium]